MSWLRYSDDFTDWPEWDQAPFEARWAYVCIVEACSRGRYGDGRLPKSKALAALVAQLNDPQQALERLALLGLVHEDRRERVLILPRIHEHVPPPGVRRNTEASKHRMRRKRAHDAGDHSLCDPQRCQHAASGTVTPLVTRNTGTGQDRESTPRSRKMTDPNARGERSPSRLRTRRAMIACSGPRQGRCASVRDALRPPLTRPLHRRVLRDRVRSPGLPRPSLCLFRRLGLGSTCGRVERRPPEERGR